MKNYPQYGDIGRSVVEREINERLARGMVNDARRAELLRKRMEGSPVRSQEKPEISSGTFERMMATTFTPEEEEAEPYVPEPDVVEEDLLDGRGKNLIFFLIFT